MSFSQGKRGPRLVCRSRWVSQPRNQLRLLLLARMRVTVTAVSQMTGGVRHHRKARCSSRLRLVGVRRQDWHARCTNRIDDSLEAPTRS